MWWIFFLKFYGAILEIPGITCRHVSPNYPHSGNNMFMCYEYHIRPEFTGYYVEMIFGENRTFFLEIAKFYLYRNIVRHHLNFFPRAGDGIGAMPTNFHYFLGCTWPPQPLRTSKKNSGEAVEFFKNGSSAPRVSDPRLKSRWYF